MFQTGKSGLEYSEIKKLFRKRKYNTKILINKNVEIILEADPKFNRWKKYLEELTDDNLNMIFEEVDNINEKDKGDYIIRAEFDHAIDLKNNKACGIDEIQTELLKYTNVDVKIDCTKYVMKYT